MCYTAHRVSRLHATSSDNPSRVTHLAAQSLLIDDPKVLFRRQALCMHVHVVLRRDWGENLYGYSGVLCSCNFVGRQHPDLCHDYELVPGELQLFDRFAEHDFG